MNRDCRHVISLVAIACCLPAAQGAPWSVTSPDGTLVLAADGGSSPNLRVSRKDQLVVPPSPWGIITRRHGPLPGNLEFDNALALATPYGGPPEKWMDTPWFPQLTAYAAGKKIAVYGWDHMCNLDTPEKRRTQLDWYVAKGFKGIKVDFLDSDVQARYRLREDLARDCAARHLLISYHGDITPRGMQRTWPNIATHEGVLAEEFYLGFGPFAPSPAYNVNLVFTRNVAGSMDYTRIAADPLTVDAAQPLVINMPANGGCGFRVMKGARNSP